MKIHPPLLLLALVASLHGQPSSSPDESPVQPPPSPTNVSICYETFSVPLALAAELQREDKSDADLYTLLAGAEEGEDGIRQESFDILRSKPSQRASAESISERIYPTEFEPPTVPTTVGVSISPSPVKDAPTPVADIARPKGGPPLDSSGTLSAPALPTAFETRNTGRVIELETSMGDNPGTTTINLRTNPEYVTQVVRSTWGQGLSKAEMPVFETQRFGADIMASFDQPLLLGTISRPPVSKVDPDSAQRVWFAFATVTLIKP